MRKILTPKLKRIPKPRPPRPKGLQCKHIPTAPILKFIAENGGVGCHWWSLPGENRRSVVNAIPFGGLLPPKIIHAKMRHLIYKGLVDGSLVGRGDFELTSNGKACLARMPHPVVATTTPPEEIVRFLIAKYPSRTQDVRFVPEYFPNGDHAIGFAINGVEGPTPEATLEALAQEGRQYVYSYVAGTSEPRNILIKEEICDWECSDPHMPSAPLKTSFIQKLKNWFKRRL